MLQAGLVVSRFVHYAALMLLFGGALFPLYGLPRTAERPAWLVVRLGRLTLAAALVALASGLAWLAFTAAGMSGVAGDLIQPWAIWEVVRDTRFGQIWAARMALSLIVLLLVLARPFRGGVALPLFSGALLASIAATGHGPQPDGGLGEIHAAADAVHLLAAGLWLGGLIPLAWTKAEARRAPRDHASREAAAILVRFSGVGSLAVAALVGSGLVNGWLLVGSAQALVTTAYGRVLTLKIALFLAMALLAAANRFQLTPALARVSGRSGDQPLRQLGRHIAAEYLLGLGVVAAVSLLGVLEPSGPA
jgi:putative copper resistance protein D